MKKLFFIFFIIPLVTYAQGVFASSYTHSGQGYGTHSTSSQFLQKNTQPLRNEVSDYKRALPENTDKPKRNSYFNDNETEDNCRQQKSPSPASERQWKMPDWWRQPNSFEGWGFD